MDSLTAMTGIASGKKRTHRGRRGRGFGAKPAPGATDTASLPPMAQAHLDKVNAAAASGNHAGVKSSAFHLVNALHALSRPKLGGLPDTSTESATELPGMDAPMVPPSGNTSSGF